MKFNELRQLFDHLAIDFDEFKSVKPLLGGRQHRVFKVCLQTGSPLVVKRLNEFTWLGFVEPSFYERVEQLACDINCRLACTVDAIAINEKPLIGIDGHFYIVYPWVEGQVKLSLSSTENDEVMRLLIGLHQCQIITMGFHAFKPLSEEAFTWMSKAHRAALHACNHALAVGRADFIVSHRDINLTNLLWHKGRVTLIDWESAGLIHPVTELIGVALNGAGIEQGEVNWQTFKYIIESYKQQSLNFKRMTPRLFPQVFYTWFAWIQYCYVTKNITQDIECCLYAIDWLMEQRDEICELLV